MLFERGNTSYVKYSLYSIFFFWLALNLILIIINKDFYTNSYEGTELSDKILSDNEIIESDVFQEAFGFYERTSEYISKGLYYFTKLPSAFLDNDNTENAMGNFLVVSIPYFISFLLFLFLLNASKPEKILIGSIVNSSIITFTIFASVISNKVSSAASFGFSAQQMASYSILNSLVFVLIYFCVLKLFVKND